MRRKEAFPMLLIIRKIKRAFFANKQFKNYLLYALGEIVLVVIGILIALQINNRNSEKQQQEKLRNYLEIIAKNTASDLESVHTIRTERQRAYEDSVRWLQLTDRDGTLSVPEVTFASRALRQAAAQHYFNANTSGYEALKSSGTLNQMAGSDIESLLYEYYDTVSRIVIKERDYNEYVKLLWLQVLGNWPAEMAQWEFASPGVLTVERFEALSPTCQELLSGTSMLALLAVPQTGGSLLIEYKKLHYLGSAFRRMVEMDILNFDEAIVRILDNVHDPRTGIGDPVVIADGQISWNSYQLINSDANDSRLSNAAASANLRSPFSFQTLERRGDSLHIDYIGGVEWAGIWVVAGTLDSAKSRDYSGFSTLVLELKGDLGGETVYVNMEDRDDPPDGTSTQIELQLTDQWKTYEIDLGDFKTADLEILTVPFGFVFAEEPVAFSVRTAKFIKAD